MLIYILVVILITIIFLFSSKSLSPIPYFPSQPVDIPLIVKALSLKDNQTIIDLGAGDGIVIFKAAQQSFILKLNTKFVAVEINPVLILVLHLRRLFHPNKDNITIIRDDIFKMNFNSLTREPVNSLTFYLYISPWFLEKTIENCKLKIVNFNVVSYMYPIKSMKKEEKIIQGKNNIFIYN
ncbi:MAG: rRNA adenine N-6-methyltransferase family protein [Patescibacteria group bacterium]|jgi:16S rRNA A1518/A1519 N6-dimethyltransferase RsmA/KsgA/DIM1 with predicted DNA glycosylase/AP lyase activity